MASKSQKLKEVFPATVLLLLLFAIARYVDFSGDFALNDDWGYSTPVRWWIEDNVFQLTHWQSMPLIPQLVGGAIWTSVFGFEQEALRRLGVLFAALGLIGTYGLARALSVPRWGALFFASLLLASPIYTTLTFSFMSDVPFAALATLATWALVASFKYEGKQHNLVLLFGAALVLLAVAQRQTGLGIPIAFLLAQFVRPDHSWGKILAALLLLVASVLLIAAVPKILSAYQMLPRVYFFQTETLIRYFNDLISLSPHALLPPLKAGLHGLSYMGLFLFPALPLILSALRLHYSWILATGVCSLVLTGLALWQNQLLLLEPDSDVLNWEGVGPRLVPGVMPVPLVMSIVLTALAFWISLTTCLAAFRNIQWRRSIPNAAAATVFLAGLISYGPHMAAYFILFDRYTLFPSAVIGLAIFSLLDLPERIGPTAYGAFALALAGIVFSALLVADHFDWQRARASVLETAVSTNGIDPGMLDAGFEANNLEHVLDNQNQAHTINWIEAHQRTFTIAKSPLEGYEVLIAKPVPQRVGPARAVYLLRKSGY
ncbi:MAG: hypothetical protein HKN27_12985 [Silicimonas sp.]|nr:hypothetical protein [Silicimonas sp.]